jgi:hypothetical protein
MIEKKPNKIQANIEDYTNFVIEGLIGIKGTSKSDVVSCIIKEWITTNFNLLTEMDLSVRNWRGKE